MTFLAALAPWVADALVIRGIPVTTVGVYGVVTGMPDAYNKVHAANRAVFLGIISLLAASAATGDPAFVCRVAPIGAFLLLTAPVCAHIIGRAANLRRQRMAAPDAGDESGRDLTEPTPAEDHEERCTAWTCC